MSTTTYDSGGSNLFLLLIGLLFLAGLAIVSFTLNFEKAIDSVPDVINDEYLTSSPLSDLPMTQHAAEGRADTTMDADAIRRMIDNGACKPVEFYICPPMNQSKAICYLKPTDTGDELWAGVLIGLQPPNKIITGYIAPYYEYWIPSIQRDGCREAIGE